MSLCKLKSHPDTLLADHLAATANLAEHFLQEIESQVNEGLTTVVRLSALCHDLGKATAYFQDYLGGTVCGKTSLTNHSFLSATAAYLCTKEALQDSGTDIDADLLPLLAYAAVRRHHGNLKSLQDELAILNEDIDLLLKQLAAIDPHSWQQLCADLNSKGFSLSLSLEKWHTGINGLRSEFRRLRRFWRRFKKEQTDLNLYTTMNLIYSILIDADKSTAGIGHLSQRPRLGLTPGLIDTFKQQQRFPNSSLNSLRQQAYEEALAQPAIPDQRIYELTLPTGMGKTFSALAFAFKLREYHAEHGTSPRIIYALPFLSIIEQNADLLEKILISNDIDPATNVFLKHHHLAEIYYRDSAGEYDTEAARLLTEGWNAEVIVTTFVQLLHTLFGWRNRSLRKFHRIMGSILVLDEVQAIPVKYWPAVRELLVYLTSRWNVYVVLSTATQPKMFRTSEAKLLVDKDKYFTSLDRVVLKPRLEQQTLEEFVSSLQLDNHKTYLFVMNTIKAAKQLYKLLMERFPNEEIAYLTTHVVPAERLKRVEAISRGEYRLCVSTQLIEAGVDISFDVIYRDLAPLDSINQTAGRCNRHNNAQGEVYVVNLADENRSYAYYIYDLTSIDITVKLLANSTEIAESQFLTMVDHYYDLASERMSADAGQQLLQAMLSLDYDHSDDYSVSQFRLIDSSYPKLDVFVEINKHAQDVWQQFLKIKSIPDRFKRRTEFDRIKNLFYSYVISIPQNVKNLPPIVEGIGYINTTSLKDYYDHKTGYCCEAGAAIW